MVLRFDLGCSIELISCCIVDECYIVDELLFSSVVVWEFRSLANMSCKSFGPDGFKENEPIF